MEIRDAGSIVMPSVPWYMDEDRIPEKVDSILDSEVRYYVDLFLKDGFVVIPDAISNDTCDEAIDQFRLIEKNNADFFENYIDEDGRYPRFVNFHLALDKFRALFYKNRISLAIQDILFERPTSLYTSLFYERGSGQELHRDTPYFCTRPEYLYFGMWVPLEDVDQDNGPLMAMVGGHKMPEINREEMSSIFHGSPEQQPASSAHTWMAYQAKVQNDGEEKGLKVKTLPVKKGSTILWHPQLPHGGAPIQDMTRTRLSLVMHTTPQGVPVYHQDVFFNPTKYFSEQSSWEYFEDNDRAFADHGYIGVADIGIYPTNRLEV